MGPKLPYMLCGIAAAVFLVLLVVLLAAVTDLLVTRGTLSVDAARQAAVPESAGPPNDVAAKAEYRERGLLPLVWRLRDTPVLGLLATSCYDRVSSLRNNMHCLRLLIAIGGLLAILFTASLYGLEWSARAAAAGAMRRIWRELFQQSTRLGPGDLLVGQKQDVVELFVDRTEALATGLTAWSRAVPYALLLTVLLVGVALWVNFWLAVCAILLAMLSRMMLGSLRRRSEQRERIWEDLARQQRDRLVEDLRQVRLLANFAAAAEPAGASLDERLRQAHIATRRRHTRGAGDESIVTLFVMCGTLLILFLAGLNVLRKPQTLTVSETMLLTTALGATIIPLRVVRRLDEALQAANPASAEIMAYIDRRPGVGQVPDAKPLARPSRELALAGVRLASAKGEKLLDNVSLEIACGTRTAVIASDSQTPLALAGLLSRLYDPAAGRILFDGQEIGEVTLASLRKQVMLLLPDRMLVTGTVADNIACGDPAITTAHVADAARQALAYDFIQKLPQGFDTIVGPHGLHLSWPEQMLLGLARVLLHNPAVVVLGESAEPLEQAAEEQLAAATERAAEGRTLIILARRLPTLRAVERILLFHAGQLHGDGGHIDLLADSELYRHLNYVRFNEFRNQVSGEW